MKSIFLTFVLIVSISHDSIAKSLRPEAEIRLNEVAKLLDMFFADCGRYPSTPEGLRVLAQKPSDCENWGPAPYSKDIPLDPWKHEYLYKLISKDKFELKSLGADGKVGGEGPNRDFVYGQ